MPVTSSRFLFALLLAISLVLLSPDALAQDELSDSSILQSPDFTSRSDTDPRPDGPDRLVLKRGSTLSGKFKKLEDDDLTFQDDSMGELEIDQSDVHRLGLPSDRDVFWQLEKRHDISSGRLRADGTLVRKGFAETPLWEADLYRLELERYSLWEFSGNFAATFTYSDGNSRTLGYGSILSMTLEHPAHIFNLSASAYYAEQERVRSAQRAKGSLGYTWLFSEHFGTYVRETLIHDAFKDLRIRSESATGMTAFIYNTDDFKWRWDLGVSYIYENLIDAPSRDYWAGQLATLVEYRWSTEVWAEATSRSTANVELSDTRNFDVSSEASIYFEVYEDIVVSFTIQHDYDSQPPPNTKRNDVRMIFSIGVAF